MKRIVFDIEADNLYDNVTQVFCIGTKDLSTGESILFEPHELSAGLAYLASADVLIGHNIIGYDLPTLEKVLDFKFDGKMVDTLILSKMFKPFRQSHSLESWGLDLGYPKIDYNNFDYYEDEMGTYCLGDVELTARLYRTLMQIINHSGGKQLSDAIELEHEVQKIQTKAEHYGVSFDYYGAMELSTKIGNEMSEIQSQAEEVLGEHIEEYTTKLKKDGTPNIHAQKRINQGFDYEIKEGQCIIKVPTKITFDTKKLFLQKLIELGWKPTMFTDKGMPRVADKGDACPNLSNIDGMKGVDVGKYFVLKHRKALIDGFFRHVRADGKIPSEADTLGAVTGRYTHRKIANLPAVRSLYGEEIRALFGVEVGRVQVGSDLAGIEARKLAHFMDDPDYTNEVINGDIHTANQVAAGLPTRDAAKTFFYGFLYGAGDAKVGLLVNGTSTDGKKIKEQFLDNLPSLKKLIEDKQQEAEKGFITSLDGRPIYITKTDGRFDTRKALNSLLQSSATIFFKRWLVIVDKLIKIKKLDAHLIISYHDEGQWSVHPKDVEVFKEMLQKALELTDMYYSVKCPNAIDIKTGKNWKDCH